MLFIGTANKKKEKKKKYEDRREKYDNILSYNKLWKSVRCQRDS